MLAKRVLIGAGALLVSAAAIAAVKADRLLRIGAGYKAKIACSEIFVAGRAPSAVLSSEFIGMDPALNVVSVAVDNGAVRARGPFGLGGVKAIYRDGYGCALANGGKIAPLAPFGAPQESASWDSPVDRRPAGVDVAAIKAALAQAFSSPEDGHRAMVVVVDGEIVAEHYAHGFAPDTPVQSWSMAKSVTATLIGAAQMRGVLEVGAPPAVPEWADRAEKAAITWDDLLRMQSGLEFGEDYDIARSDVNRMLFEEQDVGAYAARKPVKHAPGAFWYYSSGTTNILARALGHALAADGKSIFEFARDAVFGPLGAGSFVLEPDASGNFIGSSYVYATPRDWARLGQLYLNDGVWNGERLLPAGWRDYVRTPTPASDGQYGAHVWLNRDGAEGRVRFFPGLPDDMYFFAGHEGQYVFMIPDRNVVVMRSGVTRGRSAMPVMQPVLAAVYNSVVPPHGDD